MRVCGEGYICEHGYCTACQGCRACRTSEFAKTRGLVHTPVKNVKP
jgi:hypothetical protein